MTQEELVREWIAEYGYIVPARLGGHVYKGYMLGSELPRTCRRMFANGELMREQVGRFKQFRFRPNELQTMPQVNTSAQR